MLHRHPPVGRALSLIILALYLGGMYLGWQLFLASPASSSLLNPYNGMASTSNPLANRSNYSQRLYSTKDSGKSWQQIYTEKTNYLDGINCSSSSDCLVIGNNFDSTASSLSDVVINLVTGDGGQHWDTTHPKLNLLSGGDDEVTYNTSILSCPAPQNCSLLVETDTTGLASTTDGGKTWHTVNENITNEALNGLSCVSPSICNVIGQDGLILHSNDGGKSWRIQKSNTDSTLLYLSCNSTKFCLALGRSGLAVASEDGGETWVKKSTAPLKNSWKLVCVGESTCYSLGYSEQNYKLEVTHDRGVSWEILADAPKKATTDLSCPNLDTCFISTTQDGISLTADRGKSWLVLPVAEKIRVDAISCPNKATCFIIATPVSR